MDIILGIVCIIWAILSIFQHFWVGKNTFTPTTQRKLYLYMLNEYVSVMLSKLRQMHEQI